MATITKYYVDLETTLLSTDALLGDTVITVDHVYFDINDTLVIGGNSYTISAINGLDITLGEDLLDDIPSGAIVAVDDSLKDGLTPATAKRTTIFIDGADANNHSEVWVRRKSGYSLTANQTGVRYGSIIVWPKAGEFKYDTRPQEGIDAGWDDDTDIFTLDTKTFYTSLNSVSDNQSVYANMTIDSDAVDSVPMFYFKGGNLIFENCIITNKRTHRSNGPMVRTQKGTATCTIRLNDCTYRDGGETHAMMGAKASDDFNYGKELILTRCDIDCYSAIYYHCSNDYTYQNNTSLIFYATNAAFRGSAFMHGANGAYFNGYNRIKIYDGSKVSAANILKNTTTDTKYGMSPIEIDVKDSEVQTSSTMFYFYHRNYWGHESNGYAKWNFTDSKLSSPSNIVYFYRPDNKAIRQYGDIIIKRCIIDCNTTLIYMKNLSNWGRIIFSHNKILSSGKIVSSTARPSYKSSITVKDSYFNDGLVYGVDYASIDLSNVVINGLMTDASSYEIVTANNIECGGINGGGSYKIENSRIISGFASDIIPNASSAVFRGCTINSYSSKIGDGTAGQLTFIECDISGILDHSSASWRTVFDSTVNGELIPYLNTDMYCRRIVSPVFRVGGSDGAMHLSTTPGEATSIITLKNIIGDLATGASSISAFIATTASIEMLTHKGSFAFRYVDSDGESVLAPASIEIDANSSWDGLIVGVNKYKLSADIVNIGDDKTVVLEITYAPDIGDVDTEMYVDMNLKSE